MPVVSYALCSLADVKSYRGITTSSYDSILELLIDSCTDWLEKYLDGRRIKNSGIDLVEYYDGRFLRENKKSLFIKNYPIISITKISYSQEDDYSNPTWIDFDPIADYIVAKDIGQIQFFFPMPKNIQQIKIEYKGGYTTIPNDLRLVCMMLVAKQFDKRKSQGITQENIAGGAITWESGFSGDMKTILESYKNYVLI